MKNTDNAISQYMDSLTEGDKVIVAGGMEFREMLVTKAIKSQVVCGVYRFNKNTGRLLAGDPYYKTRIVVPTVSVVQAARDFILNKWIAEEFPNAFKALSLEARERIYAHAISVIQEATPSENPAV